MRPSSSDIQYDRGGGARTAEQHFALCQFLERVFKIGDIAGHDALNTSAANTGATAELMLAEILEQQEGRDVAQTYINRQLQRHPTMRVFYRLMDYHLADAEEGRAKESLLLLRDMVGEQIRTKPRYRCHKCGFTAHSLYWHCPSCRAWASVNSTPYFRRYKTLNSFMA